MISVAKHFCFYYWNWKDGCRCNAFGCEGISRKNKNENQKRSKTSESATQHRHIGITLTIKRQNCSERVTVIVVFHFLHVRCRRLFWFSSFFAAVVAFLHDRSFLRPTRREKKKSFMHTFVCKSMNFQFYCWKNARIHTERMCSMVHYGAKSHNQWLRETGSEKKQGRGSGKRRKSKQHQNNAHK